MTDPASNSKAALAALSEHARRIRVNAVRMAAVQGQGYVAQALGVADVLSVLYFRAMNYRPEDPKWEGRDRLLLSIGHYAIALYAALVEAGVLRPEDIETYGSDDSRLPMSGMSSYTPGMEISGGSLGHGLGIAVGMGLGLKRKRSASRVFNLLSDGELNEGSTWEAALSGRPLEARQPDRRRRRQQPAGRRSVERRAAIRAARRQMAGFWLGGLARRRQRPRRPSSPPSTKPCRTGAKSPASSSATPRWRRACLSSKRATRRISSVSSRTNGRRRSRRLESRHERAKAQDQRHDRLDRGRRRPHRRRAVRPCARRSREIAARHRRHDRRPRQIHRPPHLRRRLPRPLLPDGHGRAAADGVGGGHGARGFYALRHHLCRLRRRAAPTTSSTWRSPRTG